MSVRQLMLCLKQLQSRDVEEGFVKLDLIGVPTEQFEMEMEVAIAETLDAMVMDSTSTAGGNYGGQQQNRPQHLRPPQVKLNLDFVFTYARWNYTSPRFVE